MKLERINTGHHSGNATLRIVGVRFCLLFLGNDTDGPKPRNFECVGEPRNSAADNKKIELVCHRINVPHVS